MQEELLLILVAGVSHLVGLFVAHGYHIVVGSSQCAPRLEDDEQ